MQACISRSPEIGDPVSGVHNTDYDHLGAHKRDP